MTGLIFGSQSTGETRPVRVDSSGRVELAPGTSSLGRVDARGGDKLWSYTARNIASVSPATIAGNQTVTIYTVPANFVFVLQNVYWIVFDGGVTRVTVLAGGAAIRDSLVAARAGAWLVNESPQIALAAGDTVQGLYFGATGGGGTNGTVHGYLMGV